jgi:mannose/fructose/N-acetylgalactosamine-specific phosphotransferase system component IIB
MVTSFVNFKVAIAFIHSTTSYNVFVVFENWTDLTHSVNSVLRVWNPTEMNWELIGNM